MIHDSHLRSRPRVPRSDIEVVHGARRKKFVGNKSYDAKVTYTIATMEAPELDTPGPLANPPDHCQFCLTPAIQVPLKTCAKCRNAFYCVSSPCHWMLVRCRMINADFLDPE